jgi:hypothetical protein
MGKFIDLTGQRFGRLTVIERTPKPENIDIRRRGTWWKCNCDCGNKKVIYGSNLIKGEAISCGCWQKEKSSTTARKLTENLIGQKFGRLTVKERVKNPNNSKDRHYKWRCDCDCGGEVFADTHTLKSGKSKSCGCLASELLIARNKVNGYKLEKGLSGIENKIIKEYKSNAKKSGRTFSISDDDAKEMLHMPCVHCGRIDQKRNYYTKRIYFLNGLDRIDSSRGYDVGNVTPCCKQCNISKNDYTLEEHNLWIERSYFYKQQNKIEDFCI